MAPNFTLYQYAATILPVLVLAAAVFFREPPTTASRGRLVGDVVTLVLLFALAIIGEVTALRVLVRGVPSERAEDIVAGSMAGLAGVLIFLSAEPYLRVLDDRGHRKVARSIGVVIFLGTLAGVVLVADPFELSPFATAR
jgi:hypothetical protein